MRETSYFSSGTFHSCHSNRKKDDYATHLVPLWNFVKFLVGQMNDFVSGMLMTTTTVCIFTTKESFFFNLLFFYFSYSCTFPSSFFAHYTYVTNAKENEKPLTQMQQEHQQEHRQQLKHPCGTKKVKMNDRICAAYGKKSHQILKVKRSGTHPMVSPS